MTKAKITVVSKLDQLQSRWTQHLTRTDVSETERKAYEYGLSLIDSARNEHPNKMLRSVQNPIILKKREHQEARDNAFRLGDDMANWGHQSAIDALTRMREDIAEL